MKKIILFSTIPILLNSCLLLGTRKIHTYAEIGNENSTLSLQHFHLTNHIFINPTFFDKNDTLYIKIKEDFKLMENREDGTKYYSFRIHNISTDTIIIQSKNTQKEHYFIIKPSVK